MAKPAYLAPDNDNLYMLNAGIALSSAAQPCSALEAERDALLASQVLSPGLPTTLARALVYHDWMWRDSSSVFDPYAGAQTLEHLTLHDNQGGEHNILLQAGGPQGTHLRVLFTRHSADSAASIGFLEAFVVDLGQRILGIHGVSSHTNERIGQGVQAAQQHTSAKAGKRRRESPATYSPAMDGYISVRCHSQVYVLRLICRLSSRVAGASPGDISVRCELLDCIVFEPADRPTSCTWAIVPLSDPTSVVRRAQRQRMRQIRSKAEAKRQITLAASKGHNKPAPMSKSRQKAGKSTNHRRKGAPKSTGRPVGRPRKSPLPASLPIASAPPRQLPAARKSQKKAAGSSASSGQGEESDVVLPSSSTIMTFPLGTPAASVKVARTLCVATELRRVYQWSTSPQSMAAFEEPRSSSVTNAATLLVADLGLCFPFLSVQSSLDRVDPSLAPVPGMVGVPMLDVQALQRLYGVSNSPDSNALVPPGATDLQTGDTSSGKWCSVTAVQPPFTAMCAWPESSAGKVPVATSAWVVADRTHVHLLRVVQSLQRTAAEKQMLQMMRASARRAQAAAREAAAAAREESRKQRQAALDAARLQRQALVAAGLMQLAELAELDAADQAQEQALQQKEDEAQKAEDAADVDVDAADLEVTIDDSDNASATSGSSGVGHEQKSGESSSSSSSSSSTSDSSSSSSGEDSSSSSDSESSSSSSSSSTSITSEGEQATGNGSTAPTVSPFKAKLELQGFFDISMFPVSLAQAAVIGQDPIASAAQDYIHIACSVLEALGQSAANALHPELSVALANLVVVVSRCRVFLLDVRTPCQPLLIVPHCMTRYPPRTMRATVSTSAVQPMPRDEIRPGTASEPSATAAAVLTLYASGSTVPSDSGTLRVPLLLTFMRASGLRGATRTWIDAQLCHGECISVIRPIPDWFPITARVTGSAILVGTNVPQGGSGDILVHSDSLGGLSLHALSIDNNTGGRPSLDRAPEASTLRLPLNFKAIAAQKGVRSTQHDQARVWTLASLCASVDGANSGQQHAASAGDVELGDDEPTSLACAPLAKTFTVNVPPLHKCQQTAPVQTEKHVIRLLAQAADTSLIPSIPLECTSGVTGACSAAMNMSCAAAGPDILTLAATSSVNVRQQALEYAVALKAMTGSNGWALPSASRADETANAVHLHVDGVQPAVLTDGVHWTKDAAEDCSDSPLPETLHPSAADAGAAPIPHGKSHTAAVAVLSSILGLPLPTLPPARGEEDQPMQDVRRIPVNPFTHGGYNPGLTAVVHAMMLQRVHEAVSSVLSYGLSPALVRHALQQQALAHARVDRHASMMSDTGQLLQVEMVDGSLWRQDLCSLFGVQVRWPAHHALAVGASLRHFDRIASSATSSADRQRVNGAVRSRRLVLRAGSENKGIEQEKLVPVHVWNPAVLKEEGKGNKAAGRRARVVNNSKDDDDSSSDDSSGSDVASGDDGEMPRPRHAAQPSSGVAAQEHGPSDTMRNLRRQQREALLQLKAICSGGPASAASAGSVRLLEQQMLQVRAALSDQATTLSLLHAPISLFSLTETLKTRLRAVDISAHAVAQVMHELWKDEVCSILHLPQGGQSSEGKPQGTPGLPVPVKADSMDDADAMEAAEANSMQVENETGLLVRAIDGIPRDHVASTSLQACLKDVWIRVPSAALLGAQSMTSDTVGSAQSSSAAAADELPAGTVPPAELAKKSGLQLAALIHVKPVRVKVTAPSSAALKKKPAAPASPSEDDSDDVDDGSSTDGPSTAAGPVGQEPQAYKWKDRVVRIRVMGQDGKKYSIDTGAGICDGMGTLPVSHFEACLQRAARAGGPGVSAPVAWAAVYSPPPRVRVKNVWTKSVVLGRFGSPLEACAFAQVYAAWPQACMPLPAQATRHEVVQALKRLPALWAQVATAMVQKVARSVHVALPAASSSLLKRVQPVEATFPPRAEGRDDGVPAANPLSMDARGHDQPCSCPSSAYVPCASRSCLLPHRILYMRPDTSSVTSDGTVAALAPPYEDVGRSEGTHKPLAGKVYHVKPEDRESPSFKAAFKTGFASDLRWMVGIAGTKRFHAGMPRKTGNNEERAKSAGARAGALNIVSSSSTSKPESATAPSAEDGDHGEDDDDGQLASLLGVSQASRAPVSSYSQAGRTPSAFMASQYTAVSSIRPSFGARLGQGTADDASTREDDEDEADGWGASGAAERGASGAADSRRAPAASASGKRSYGRPIPPAAARAYIEGRLTSLDGTQVRISEARAWQAGLLSAKSSAARVAKVGQEHALTCHPLSTVSPPILQQLAARWHAAVQDPSTGGIRPRAYRDEFTAEEEQGEEDEEEQEGDLPSASAIGPQGDDHGDDEEDEEGDVLQQALLSGSAWRAQQQAQNAAKPMEDDGDDEW